MADKVISDTPDWFNTDVPDEYREAAIELDFEDRFSNDPDFAGADPAVQQEYRQAHRQLIEETALKSPHNPVNQKARADQRAVDRNGFVRNLLGTTGRSLENTVQRIPMVDDLAGRVDSDYPTQLSKYLTKTSLAPQTRERKQLARDMKLWDERTDESGFLGDVVATAKLVGDIAANPGGVLDVAAESLGSMASMATGAKAGATAAAGLTAATGGWAAPAAPFITAGGMFAAEMADAGSAKMAEKIREALDERELAYTPSNIQMLMEGNPELIKQFQKDSLKYGGILGAVDVLMGGFFSKMATLPTRAARKEAMRSMDDASRAMLAEKAKELGVPVKDITEDFINRGAKDILDARSFKQKLKPKAASYAGEVASEPLSEAAATAGIGEEIQAEELIYETLGGIGAGPIGASINTAAMGTKLAANKTGEFTKKILSSTPESRKISREQKEVAKQTKKLRQSEASYGFKKEVETAQPTDASVEEYSDPEKETYDPIKAAAILSKSGDVDAHDKIKAVEGTFKQSLVRNLKRSLELQDKHEAGDLTREEEAELLGLQPIIEEQQKTFQKIQKYSEVSNNRRDRETQKQDVAPLDVDTASSEEVTDHVIESFGSRGNRNTATVEQIDRLLKRQDLSDTDRTLLGAMKEAEQVRSEIGGSSKNLEEVSNDIYRGQRGSEFKGIDAYKQAISHYLNRNVNDVEKATRELEGLKKFRDAHQLKADRMAGIFEAVTAGKPLTLDQKSDLAELRLTSPDLKIHKGSGRLVAAVQQEAAALDVEVKLAESLFQARSALPAAPTVSETRVPRNKPETSSPVPPKAEVIANARKHARRAVKALASTEVLTKEEEKIRKKYGEAVAKAFNEEVALAIKEDPAFNKEPEQKQETDAEPVQSKNRQKSSEEITKSSTSDDNAGTVANKNVKVSSDIEYKDPGEMDVEYTDTNGTRVTKPYNEAIENINTEIEEAKLILLCVKTK